MTPTLKGAALAASIQAAEKALPAAIADVNSAQRRLDHCLAQGADTSPARAALAQAIQRRQDAHHALTAAQQQAEARQHDRVAAVAAGLIAGANAHITALINRYTHEGQTA
jgi:hypothetical protein